MKMDIDTIFYIILSIIILVVSGLGSRRRKQAQQLKAPGTADGSTGTPGPEAGEMQRPGQPAMDPFERLEQILTGQTRYESMEGESLEVLEDEEEIIEDEEEQIPNTRHVQMEKPKEDMKLEREDKGPSRVVEGLFEDLDEITRAVIYSEIIPRKYT